MNLNLPLAAHRYYHIYNRGVNRENIFKENRNYIFFLEKYFQFLSPVVDTLAYCLLRNHFHLLIRVKDEESLCEFHSRRNARQMNSTGLHSAEFIVSKQFAKLFSSYTQSVNKVYKRTGSLIETPFKRILVKDENYLTQLIRYIHLNPQKHRIVDDFRSYEHSSYQGHLDRADIFLSSDEVINWFGGSEGYIEFHRETSDLDVIKRLVLE